MSSDGHIGVDLNDDNDGIEEIRPPPRLVGRDNAKAQGKRKGKATSSNSSIGTERSTMAEKMTAEEMVAQMAQLAKTIRLTYVDHTTITSSSEGADHFAAVHKIFGASNASKLLMKLPLQDRGEAAISLSYEALARLQDPVYGCVAQIFALEQQVAGLQEEIDQLLNYMTYVSSEFNGTSVSDHLNQQTTPLFAAPQVSSTSLAILEGQNSLSHSLLDQPLMESF
ncbi:unnamed protein product [Lactuca saligna]|uniref:LOB domain-containing protein n=1 Tax=Lactuca saligna TaxID=75948 RepID=A0AA36A2N8_LACSI|nr:unnamed protein product [Lactuca saligna]